MKLESLQRTGSFKARGAANRLLKMTGAERARGVVAASSGNHGLAVARLARELGAPCVTCVPDWTDSRKMKAIKEAGAIVEVAGDSYDMAEERARALSDERGLSLIHPFDDLDVIEGQGTLVPEILQRFPDAAEIIAPLSGGGLAAGIGVAAKEHSIRVVAASAAKAQTMRKSVRAGRPLTVSEEPTIASALSGGIGIPNRHTFDLTRALVSEHVVVPEEAIKEAVRRVFHKCRLVVEGGGAVGLAALWAGIYRPRRPAAVIVSGGNIDLDLWIRIVST